MATCHDINGNTWKTGTGSHVQKILRIKRQTTRQCNRIHEMQNHCLMQINDAREVHIGIDLFDKEQMLNQLHSLLRTYFNLKTSSKLNQLISQLMTPAIIISNMLDGDGTFSRLTNHVCSCVF